MTKSRRIAVVTLGLLICIGALMLVPNESNAASTVVKTKSKTVCGYTFTLKTTFEKEKKFGQKGARVKSINYTIKKGKKITGKIINYNINYGGIGASFYYHKKEKRWKKAIANDNDYKYYGSVSHDTEGRINAPSNFKYAMYELETALAGATIEITYRKNGKNQKNKYTYFSTNMGELTYNLGLGRR